MSASRLMLVLTSKWQVSLNKEDDTVVVALDIAGNPNKMWHSGLLVKLESFGLADGSLFVWKLLDTTTAESCFKRSDIKILRNRCKRTAG